MRQNLYFNSLLSSGNILYDINDNPYTTVSIGDQEWIVQNFRATKYADGENISHISDTTTWANDSSGGYCWYNNDITNKNPYGALYNWYVVNSSHGIVYFKRNGVQETGWKVPSDDEWTALINVLEGDSSAGGILKEVGLTHWNSPNTGATDHYGFKMLGSSYRNSSGTFDILKNNGVIWLTTEYNSTYGKDIVFRYDFKDANYNTYLKTGGFSIRCVKDIDTSVFLKFTTNASTIQLNPEVQTTGGIVRWNLGDASYNVNSNTPIHTYSISGTKYVKVSKGSTTGGNSITSLGMYGDSITGVLDISSLTNLTIMDVAVNPGMTRIINPVSSALWTQYWAYMCDLTGTLDVSGLSNLGGSFNVPINPKLNKILNPVSTQTFNTYNAYNCGLMGTLDVSGLTGLGGVFQVYNNASLNYILNPSSNQIFTTYYAYYCGLVGTLDVSGLKNLGGEFDVRVNPSLNYILNPSSNQIFTKYWASSCDISGTLNLKPLKNLGGSISVAANPRLTNILFPDTSVLVTVISAESCNLTGTLDVSNLVGLGQFFGVHVNPSLNYILHPNSSQGFIQYRAHTCDIRTLDVSKLINIGGSFEAYSNLKMTDLVLPNTLTRQFTLFDVKNCSLNTSSLNAIFSKMHALYDASAPITGMYVYANGSNNAWPTDGSANADIVAIKSVFNGKGLNASIYVNDPPGDVLLLSFTTDSSVTAFTPDFTVV